MTYCDKDRDKQSGRQDKKDSMNIVWKMQGITHTVCHGGMEYDIFRKVLFVICQYRYVTLNQLEVKVDSKS